MNDVQTPVCDGGATTFPTDTFHLSFPDEWPYDAIVIIKHPRGRGDNFGHVPKPARPEDVKDHSSANERQLSGTPEIED